METLKLEILIIKPRCNGGRRSTLCTVTLAMLPAQRFWREKVSLLDVMYHKVTYERAHFYKKFPAI